MKEMLKSKVLIGFIVLVLGMTYMNSTSIARLEENNSSSDKIIAMNVK